MKNSKPSTMRDDVMKTKTAIFTQAVWPKIWSFSEGMQIILGSLYIALLSQIQIPLQPVPVTLQTFAIFSLALFEQYVF